VNTPAFTTATACSNAETGAGATIAAGNQPCSGISAAFAAPNTSRRSSTFSITALVLPGSNPPGVNVVDPATLATPMMPGRNSTTDAPTSVPR
jgi:hypothetical protein